jgi:GTP-binding protein
MAGSEARSPIEDLQHLRRELDLYDPRLSQRPWRVVANKVDLESAAENLRAFNARFPDIETVAVSAATGEGIAEFKERLGHWLGDSHEESEIAFYGANVNRTAE